MIDHGAWMQSRVSESCRPWHPMRRIDDRDYFVRHYQQNLEVRDGA